MTPLGYSIDGAGISPDVRVSLDSDSDNQKAYAVAMAASGSR